MLLLAAVTACRILAGEVEVINIFYRGRDYEALLRDDAAPPLARK